MLLCEASLTRERLSKLSLTPNAEVSAIDIDRDLGGIKSSRRDRSVMSWNCNGVEQCNP